MKFGGSSVKNAERIAAVTEIVKEALTKDKVAVVVSALGGITDVLLDAAENASKGTSSAAKLAEVERRHLEIAEVLVSSEDQLLVKRRVGEGLAELRDLLKGIELLGECSPRTLDKIVSYGERLSSILVSAAMRQAGVEAQDCDARELLITDDNFGHARVHRDLSYARIREHFANNQKLQVVTGFIGRNQAGDTTTIGRSGSDLTAALVGAALGVTVIEIWTDVDGVMSTDPRLVPEAFSLPSLSYEELMELSHFGAKVVFPPTVTPARELKIPLLIKNTLNPSFPGTIIDTSRSEDVIKAKDECGNPRPITGIASIHQIAMMRLEGEGMMGVPGVAARLFEALAQENISIILISQATSEHSICFAIDPKQSAKAQEAVEQRFGHEMARGMIKPLVIEDDSAVIAIVGEGMHNSPGIAGRLFRLLGRRGINVRAIAQGSSERNISIVIAQADEIAALRAIHESFFGYNETTLKLAIAGVGGVGAALLSQLRRRLPELVKARGIDVRVVTISNSTHQLHDPCGIDLDALGDDWRAAVTERGVAAGPEALAEKLESIVGPRALIDCTASSEVTALYGRLLASGASIITANKISLAGPIGGDPREGRSTGDRGLYYEATVGAGLPIIRTVQGLVGTGDPVHKIQGAFSGTLSFLMGSLRSGTKFSAAVREADRLGYTEPDPRDDLSGMDVARKLVILAREVGHRIELSDLDIEPLYDPAMADLSIEEFWQQLPTMDEAMAAQVDQATENGQALAYLASFEVQEGGEIQARVGLEVVDGSHPAAGIVGTDNFFAFNTGYYRQTPLVVQGPGAGAEVTAGGLFADILRAHAESVGTTASLTET